MKHFLVILLLLYSLSSFSQDEKTLVLGVFKANTITPFNINPLFLINNSEYSNDRHFRNYGIIAGLEFNKKLSLSIELIFMNLADGSAYGGTRNQNMKTFKSGLNLSYRFLENKMFSPKIALRGGFFPYSDIKDKTVNPETLNSEVKGDEKGKYIFDSWDLYGSLDALLSIKINNFDLNIGAELNYMSYSLSYEPYYGSTNYRNSLIRNAGIGLKFAFIYMIPFKSKGKSKVYNDTKIEKI